MIPVSDKFLEKMNAGVSEPRFRLNAILTDIAAASQGATATASDQFSVDFPPAGAIDGTLHHLNFGPAITAEDRAGRSGWKSASASQNFAVTGRAGLAGGIFNESVLLDDGVRARGVFDLYLQTFDSLANGNIVGQDGWIDLGMGLGIAEIETDEVITGTKSLRLKNPSAGGTGVGIGRVLQAAPGFREFSISFNYKRKVDEVFPATFMVRVKSTGILNGPSMGIYNNGTLWLAGDSTINLPGAVDLATHLYSLRIKGSVADLYMDGALVLSRPYTPVILNDVWISANGTAPDAVLGIMDDLDVLISGYNEDAEGRTLGPLSGQDGWTVFSGTGTINVVNTATPGLYGQTIELNGALNRVIRRTVTRSSRCYFQFKASLVIPGSQTGLNYNYSYFGLRDQVANQTLVELRYASYSLALNKRYWEVWINGGVVRRLAFFDGPDSGSWAIEVGTRTGGSVVRIWLDGKVVDQFNIPTLSVDQLELGQFKGTGTQASVIRMDSLRYYQYQLPEAIWEKVFDLGVTPSSGRALLSWTSLDSSVRPLAGPFYEFSNSDSQIPIRRASAPQNILIAQTFTATEDRPLAEVTFLYKKNGGTPPNTSNLYVALRDVTGTGAPAAKPLVRGKTIVLRNIVSGTNEWPVVVQFPQPWHLKTGRTYALVWSGNWTQSDTNNISIGADSSAPTLAGGSLWFSNDGSTWTQNTGVDIVFGLRDKWSVVTEYDKANRDSSMPLCSAPPNAYPSCGFVLDRETRIGAARVFMRAHEGFVPNYWDDDLWFEIQSDDGTGRASNEVLCSMSRRDSGDLKWGGTEAAPVFEFYVCNLGTPKVLPAGTYHLVVKGSLEGDTSLHWDVGVDTSGIFSGYMAEGGYDRPISWTAYPGRVMIFSILTELIPYYRFEAAYSSDGLTWSSFYPVAENGARSLSGSASFTGQTMRYWKIRALGCRCPTAYREHPISPILTGITVRIITVSAKALTIALGTPRTISRIEVFAHPLEGGLASFKYQTSTNGTIWTDVEDFRLLEARGRGGGASASAAGPIITTDGQYVAADLSEDLLAVTHFRLIALDTGDGYARVVEIRAFRTVDFGDRVTGDPSIGQQADFTQRAFKGRTISLTLNNTDGYLSPLGTNGGYNAELGEGLRFIFHTSYQEVLDEVRVGEFYVDNWKENPSTALINVAARDISKKADVPVSTRFKSNKASWEVFEYLMNLANVPSQWLAIDRTANRIKYFAPAELNAWQESKRIAEAAGFAQVFVDRDGYIYFRSTGTTASDTGVPLLAGATDGRRTIGPVVDLDGSYYCLPFGVATSGPIQNTYGFLHKWDETSQTWVSQSGSFLLVTGSGIAGGAIYSWNGRIFFLLADNYTVYSWAPGETTWTVESEGVQGWNFVVSIFGGCPWSYREDNLAIIDNNVYGSNWSWAVDFETMWLQEIRSGQVRKPLFRVVKWDDDRYYALAWNVTINTCYLMEWHLRKAYRPIPSGDDGTIILVVSVGSNSCYGVGWDYDRGELYYMAANRLGIRSNIPAVLQRIRLHKRGWQVYPPTAEVANISGNLWGSADIGVSGGDAILYQEGLVSGFGGEILGAETSALTQFFIYDRDSGNTTVPGPVSPSNTEGRMLVATTRHGNPWAWGIIDGVKVYDFQTRVSIVLDPSAVLSLADQPDSLLISTSVDHGMDMGGDNRLINLATVKSEPFLPQASEVLWQGENLPWSLAVTARMKFKIKLSDPGINLVPSISTTPPGIATMTVESSGLQVEINVTFAPTATGCEITAISVSGNPLRKTSTYLRTVVGKASSIERFGIRSKTIENDYVYDPISASMMGTWLVTTGQDQKAKAEGVNAMALWVLELLDVIRITDSRSGMDAEFYITGYTHRYRSQKSTLTLIAK